MTFTFTECEHFRKRNTKKKKIQRYICKKKIIKNKYNKLYKKKVFKNPSGLNNFKQN